MTLTISHQPKSAPQWLPRPVEASARPARLAGGLLGDETYYHDLDHTYEYNNGLLEKRPIGRQIQAEIFLWFADVLCRYLGANPIGSFYDRTFPNWELGRAGTDVIGWECPECLNSYAIAPLNPPSGGTFLLPSLWEGLGEG